MLKQWQLWGLGCHTSRGSVIDLLNIGYSAHMYFFMMMWNSHDDPCSLHVLKVKGSRSLSAFISMKVKEKVDDLFPERRLPPPFIIYINVE